VALLKPDPVPATHLAGHDCGAGPLRGALVQNAAPPAELLEDASNSQLVRCGGVGAAAGVPATQRGKARGVGLVEGSPPTA
jgi:hypothetical protein